MENVLPGAEAAASSYGSPPPAPDPTADAKAGALDPCHLEKSDKAYKLTLERWDVDSISALGAMRMLIQALESLAEETGDIPPTPPVSRPTTPRPVESDVLGRVASNEDGASTYFCIGSPEAHPHEPITVAGAEVEDVTAAQQDAIARRFFSKVPPRFSLSEYLLRLHKHCPHSPGVYLAAASYCHHLCVSDLIVPATKRTIHRLALAAIRVAAKALEDNKWRQQYFAQVGGVSGRQLLNLEVALCYLLDFNLWVDQEELARRMFWLQQAAANGSGARGRLRDNFRLKLPLRRTLAKAAACRPEADACGDCSA